MRAAAVVRQPLITTTLALAIAFSALAQKPVTPDLSGRWVFNPAKSKLSKDVTIGSETIVITCPNSTIRFHFTTDGKESTETYTPDGKDHMVKEFQGGQAFSKAQWKKSVLVTESSGRLVMPNSTADGYQVIHDRDRWALSSDGRVLTREVDDPKQVFVYDKQ
jgi:hypothetical protein